MLCMLRFVAGMYNAPMPYKYATLMELNPVQARIHDVYCTAYYTYFLYLYVFVINVNL